MTTYNHSSSYNRTYERKVIEEGSGGNALPFSPGSRLHSSSSPIQTIKSTLSGFPSGASSSFMNPHNYHFGTSTSGSFSTSDDNFSAVMDVSPYSSQELKVSVVNQQIVVEGKHPEKADDLGFIERHFIRKFALPRNVHPELVTSNLTADGMLTITGQAKPKENSPARTIPIKIVTSPMATPSNGQMPKSENVQQNGN